MMLLIRSVVGVKEFLLHYFELLYWWVWVDFRYRKCMCFCAHVVRSRFIWNRKWMPNRSVFRFLDGRRERRVGLGANEVQSVMTETAKHENALLARW
jgi:hypothetical protein